MITKSNTRHWATGISLRWTEHAGSHGVDGQRVSYSGWAAKLEFYDDGFCDDDPDKREVSTQGTLVTRYAVRDGEQVSGLSLAIDTLLADAERFGIELRGPGRTPNLYYEGDGEDVNYPPPPGWHVLLAAESARLGWDCIYAGREESE